MGKLFYLLSRSKSETKNYIILIFWSTSIEESGCEIEKTKVVQEVPAEYQFRITVEYALASKRLNILYLINNYKLELAQSDENSHLCDVRTTEYYTSLEEA